MHWDPVSVIADGPFRIPFTYRKRLPSQREPYIDLVESGRSVCGSNVKLNGCACVLKGAVRVACKAQRFRSVAVDPLVLET